MSLPKLDHVALGTEEDDIGVPTDRNYWEKRSTPRIMKLVDQIHTVVQKQDSGVALKYNKHYIGLAKDGVANNYVSMRPRKKNVLVHFRIQRSDEVTDMIEDAGIGTLPYDKSGNSGRGATSPSDADSWARWSVRRRQWADTDRPANSSTRERGSAPSGSRSPTR